MIVLVETTIIISYMVNNILGTMLMLTYVIWKLLVSKKNNSFYRMLELMIIALPMAYIGIAGSSMHQLISWYNSFLVVFIIHVIVCFHDRFKVTIWVVVCIFVLVLCLLLNVIWTTNALDELIEIAQVLVMVIPITIIHSVKKDFSIARIDVYHLLYEYVDICVSTAIAMLFQYVMFYYGHKQVGLIHFFGHHRVQFYVLFKGASILPVFMGIGLVFLFLEFLEKKKASVLLLAKMSIIFLAATLNTSRTALFSMMVILALVSVKHIIRTPSVKGVFAVLFGFTGSYFAINYITRLRSNLTSFLDSNGRLGTLKNGINIWEASLKNFILGEGFTGGRWEEITKPHNLVVQTLAQCGIVVTFVTMLLLGKFVADNRTNEYKIILYYVILSGMFVTDFYANAFTTVIFILVDLYQNTHDNDIHLLGSVNRRINSLSKEEVE